MMIRIDAPGVGGKPSVAARHSKRKGTVVMLHGWAQNARVFHNRTAKLAKYVGLHCCCRVYLVIVHIQLSSHLISCMFIVCPRRWIVG